MADKIIISKLVLTTSKGADIDVTIAEARDLYEQLRQLFERQPVYVPSVPIVVERDCYPYWDPYQPRWVADKIYCQSESGLSVAYCGVEPNHD